jgi:hypothetical protein
VNNGKNAAFRNLFLARPFNEDRKFQGFGTEPPGFLFFGHGFLPSGVCDIPAQAGGVLLSV